MLFTFTIFLFLRLERQEESWQLLVVSSLDLWKNLKIILIGPKPIEKLLHWNFMARSYICRKCTVFYRQTKECSVAEGHKRTNSFFQVFTMMEIGFPRAELLTSYVAMLKNISSIFQQAHINLVFFKLQHWTLCPFWNQILPENCTFVIIAGYFEVSILLIGTLRK